MKNDATMENGATMTDDADIIINVLTTAPKERCKVYLKDEPLSLAKLQDRQRELADQMELAKKKGENLDFEALEGRLQEAKKAFETLGEAIGESHEITPERINRLFYEQVPENLNPEEQQARHIAVAYQNVLIPLNAMQVLLNASFSDVEESNKELIEPMGKLAISSQEGTVSNNNNVKPQQKYVDTPNPSAQQPPATPLVSIGDGGQFVVTPSQELIEAYTKDIIEPDTYLQEAEGSVAANHLGICVAAFQGKRRYFDNIDKKPLPITSSGTMGPGDMANGTVLHINGNHFIVIEQCAQSEAQYVDGTGTFYREGKRTRADGSCLLDGMNIIANGKSIKDDEVKKLREVIAETIDPEDVKQVLTAMIVTELTTGEEPQGIGAVTQGLIYGDKALAPILEEKRLEKEQKREKEELERQQQRLRDPRNAPPLLNDLLRQLANENDPVSRKEIGSACMKRIKALAATTCEQGELDTLEKAVEAICAATPETLPKAVSEASKPAQAVETKVVENTPGWSQVQLQSFLEVTCIGQKKMDSKTLPCISVRSLPRSIQTLLKGIIDGSKDGNLVFSLDARNGLAHTPHWDTDNMLPWGDGKERPETATEIGAAFGQLGEIENNIKKAVEKSDDKRIKTMWAQKQYPATMEYAALALGPSARVIVSYDASLDGPVAFISSHYGASLDSNSERKTAQFLIEDIDELDEKSSDSLERAVKLTPKQLQAISDPKELKKVFPFLWKLAAPLSNKAVEVDNPQFLQALAKKFGEKSFTFQDIFDVDNEGHDMKFVEIAKDAKYVLPEDAFDMHISVRAEDMTVHVALRPWADRQPGYASSNVGLPTSYFWFRLFVDGNKFVLAAPSGGDPFGQSKLNAMICWSWLEQQGEEVKEVFQRTADHLKQCVDRLNEKVRNSNVNLAQLTGDLTKPKDQNEKLGNKQDGNSGKKEKPKNKKKR